MRVLITGAGGQLGRELLLTKPASIDILALNRSECDVSAPTVVNAVVSKFRPHIIINAAAFTDVNAAESETDAAFRINSDGAANVAHAAKQINAHLLHISTDYVFDGRQSMAYSITSRPNPINAYGASKLAGEEGVLASGASATIVRTAWLYAETGRNFVTTILRLLKKGNPISVVSDQVGTPTAAQDLAEVLWRCASNPQEQSILHWTNSGIASWYDFAIAIQELAVDRRIVDAGTVIMPISSHDYPSPAPRPTYSVLDSFLAWSAFGPARHWRNALAHTLDKLLVNPPTERAAAQRDPRP